MDNGYIFDSNCTTRCTSTRHGNLITSALTRTSCSDDALLHYMSSVCSYFHTSRDGIGRLALHMAASCGKAGIVRWLVEHRGSNADERDSDGQGALHRALFYGKIHAAVALQKLGADMRLLDNDNLTPLEHVMKDADFCERISDRGVGGEMFGWGANANFTLGTHQSTHPELLTHFHREHTDELVTYVCLDKYHCVVSTESGKVYAWGHGQGGRLGLNTDGTVLKPQLVGIELNVRKHPDGYPRQYLAVGRDHTLFVDQKNQVWACGCNAHSALGVTLREKRTKTLAPLQVRFPDNKPVVIQGVACSMYHSVAYSSTELYTWGLNAGALGHSSCPDKYIKKPRHVTAILNSKILHVICCSTATAVLTDKSFIYILYKQQCRRINCKTTSPVYSLSMTGGQLSSKDLTGEQAGQTGNAIPSDLSLAGVTKVGTVYLWRESDAVFRRCLFNIGRLIIVRDFKLHSRGCVFTTNYGEVFDGFIKKRNEKLKTRESEERCKEKSEFHRFVENDECVWIKVSRVSRLHRAHLVVCDPTGDNFVAIQDISSRLKITSSIPTTNRNSLIGDLKNLLMDSAEDDCITDFSFNVRNVRFYCHRFILAHAGTEMKKAISNATDNCAVIENVHPVIFQQVLEFIYTGSCELLIPGKCPEKFCSLDETVIKHIHSQIKSDATNHSDSGDISAYNAYQSESRRESTNNIVKATDPLVLLTICAKHLGVTVLVQQLKDFHFRAGMITTTKYPKIILPVYSRSSFCQYRDVVIICKDKVELSAHKCMLIRCEYFNNILSLRWNQENVRKTILMEKHQAVHVSHLLDFIYSEAANSNLDIETLLTLLVLADEFMMTNFRVCCEHELLRFINIKTVVNLYQCAIVYGASLLHMRCMQFIVAHLAEVLESRSLDCLDDAALISLSEYYWESNDKLHKRYITPFSYAPLLDDAPPSDFDLASLETQYAASQDVARPVKRRQRKSKSSFSETSNSESANNVTNKGICSDKSCETEDANVALTLIKSIEGQPPRLRAINAAMQRLSLENHIVSDGYVNFSTSNSFHSSSFDDSFPDLQLGTSSTSSTFGKSPGKVANGADQWRQFPKMSQKARKRLQSETSQMEMPPSPPVASSPWKVIETDSSANNVSSEHLDTILLEEKTLKSNLQKMLNKSLIATQIEDRAILELQKFYNVDNVVDEIISVERLNSGVMASPVWVPRRTN